MKLKRNSVHSPYTPLCMRIGATIVLSLAIILCAGSLASYYPCDASCIYYSSAPDYVHNWFGVWGAHIAAVLLYCFGYAAWLWMGILLYSWYCVLTQWTWHSDYDRIIALVSLPFIGAAYLHMHTTHTSAGGLFGAYLARLLWYCFEFPGALIGVYSISFIVGIIAVRPPLVSWIHTLCSAGDCVLRFLTSKKRFWRPLHRIIYGVLRILAVRVSACIKYVTLFFEGWPAQTDSQKGRVFEYTQVACQESVLHDDPFWRTLLQPEMVQNQLAVSDNVVSPAQDATVQVQQEPLPAAEGEIETTTATYRLPHVSLFVDSGKKTDKFKTELEQLARTLEEKLERFDVRGRVVTIKPGPVVTLYEYQPEIDSKISKIIALEDDLALALQAVSIRIIAPIPGRCVVGFEVSNTHRTVVMLSDTIRSPEFSACSGALPLILGEDTVGNNVVVDLASMPHLLIAGSTGSGKSVALNAMLVSLLCKRTPDEVRLILIDPKRLEFAAYADIAHLLFPIVTDPKTATAILRWTVEEMERRYECIVQEGVRNSTDYNKRVDRQRALPRIVVIIDELADLMMTAGRDVEHLITRIAQMARAAGIHMIVATQRPSVEVITGLIKANFPSRISFRVTSKVDSRIILDCVGADKLLGRGDMLFLDAGSALLQRVHGAYVSDKEIQDLVQHIKAERKVEYLALPQALEGDAHPMSDTDRQLYNEVLAYINEVEEISISLLQRKFRIGYNRSARIIDLLEQQGRIMPSDGGKMRRVLR